MKKVLALMLALVLVMSLAACGGSGENKDGTSGETKATEVENTTTYSLGETVSTDIVDFKLEKAQFSYYANGYANPTKENEEPKGGYGLSPYTPAKTGQCMVCLTYTIKNKDRSYLEASIPDAKWLWNFTVNYKGEKYDVSGLNDEKKPIYLTYTCLSMDGGSFNNVNSNYIMESGDEWTIRAVGYIDTDPDSLDDGFEITVNVINSSSKDEFFTYKVGK